MGPDLIDLSQIRNTPRQDLPGLHAFLSQLVGEPFRFARVSYGDELRLHFGDLGSGRTPRLKHVVFGTWILGLRASHWLLKSGLGPVLVNAGVLTSMDPSGLGTALRKEEFESGTFIVPESRVLAAVPFVVKPVGAFGLELRMSDGSSLTVLPTPPEPDEPEDEGLPEVADWELVTPRGLLRAGPGLEWSFQPDDGTA